MFAAFHYQSPLITMVCFSTLFISLEIAYFADFFRFLAKKKKKAEYRPVRRGVRRVRSLPSQAPEVHLLVDQLFKTKGINTIFILIRWMCSRIENTVKELTSLLTLSTEYILTFL